MEVSENFIFYGFVLMVILHFVWNFYLSYRQLMVFLNTTRIPPELADICKPDAFHKSRHYAIYLRLFRVFEYIYGLIVNLICLSVQYLPLLWNFAGKIITFFGYEPVEFVQTLIFVIALNTLHLIAHIPSSIYFHRIMKGHHNFSSQPILSSFFKRIKRFFCDLTVTIVPMFCVEFSVDAEEGLVYPHVAIFILLGLYGAYTVYFNFIAPVCFKLSPLPEGQLKNKVNQIVTSVGFPLRKVFIANRPLTSPSSNAYLSGFLGNERIVLNKTLIKDIEATDMNYGNEVSRDDVGNEEEKKKNRIRNEILAVVCHELGHWKCSHLKKKVLYLVVTSAMLISFQTLIDPKVFCKAFGFSDSMPPLLDLLVVVQMTFLPLNELINLGMGILSRQFEFQSDKFCKTLGKSPYLKRALKKISQKNLGFPVNDPLYSAIRISHPPLLERLRALDKDD